MVKFKLIEDKELIDLLKTLKQPYLEYEYEKETSEKSRDYSKKLSYGFNSWLLQRYETVKGKSAKVQRRGYRSTLSKEFKLWKKRSNMQILYELVEGMSSTFHSPVRHRDYITEDYKIWLKKEKMKKSNY